MEEREVANKNMILKTQIGSNLYGTNTLESDVDYMGIFVPDQEHILGLLNVDEVNLSKTAKDSEGKNTVDAVDFKVYSLKKFLRLALDNNPNILEVLFVNKENILFQTVMGKHILASREHFLSKNIKTKFMGYAMSQKHKMLIKAKNYGELEDALEYLKSSKVKYIYEANGGLFHEIEHDLIEIGDLRFNKNTTIKRVIESLQNRVGKFGLRKLIVDKFGYDTKFAMHLMRLIMECLELIRLGSLTFPLAYRKYLLEIRTGQYKVEDILEMADRLEDAVNECVVNSPLPEKPNFGVVNSICIGIHKSYVCQGKILL